MVIYMKNILLHTCCAPCAAGCVEMLLEQSLRPTLFFANSNLDTEEEFERRLDAVRQLAALYALPLAVAPYEHNAWRAAVAGLEKEPERGARCRVCFAFSLDIAARHCRDKGMDGFATSLTVSPHKSSPLLLSLGGAHAEFHPFDFKKKGGFLRGRAIARENNFYAQNFCGCEFSRARLKK